jgi:hypothetical protein
MIRIEISVADFQALQREKQSHSDSRVRRRMETLHLKGLGYSHQECSSKPPVVGNALMSWNTQSTLPFHPNHLWD